MRVALDTSFSSVNQIHGRAIWGSDKGEGAFGHEHPCGAAPASVAMCLNKCALNHQADKAGAIIIQASRSVNCYGCDHFSWGGACHTALFVGAAAPHPHRLQANQVVCDQGCKEKLKALDLLTRSNARGGGRYWTRTSDLVGVNDAL